MKTWFPSHERRMRKLPRLLEERLAMLTGSSHPMRPEDHICETGSPRHQLKVSFTPLESPARQPIWALLLEENPYLPPDWRRKFTKREIEVASGVVQGWDNRTIAEDLKCSVDTVKKHLQHIFDKVGVDQRAKLISLAKP